jgi:hypothetical protein
MIPPDMPKQVMTSQRRKEFVLFMASFSVDLADSEGLFPKESSSREKPKS